MTRFYSWATVAAKQDRSTRTCKRHAFDPDDAFPLPVEVNSQASLIVADEYDEYAEAFIAARRGDPDAQKKLDEMVERKRAILARMGKPQEPENLRRARGADSAQVTAAVAEEAL